MNHKSTITILIENQAAGQGMLAEHGFSCLIEHNGRQLLFDTGQGLGNALFNNAKLLDIDLNSIDGIALSHGHYDHTGNLKELLLRTPQVPIFAHPALFAEHYSKNSGELRKIGCDISAESINNLSTNTSAKEIMPGIFLTGEIPRQNTFEDCGGSFFLDDKGSKVDTIIDDQAIYFFSNEELVVILGCAHAGVINTLNHIKKLTNNAPIHTLIGGMHLIKANNDRIKKTCEELKKFNIKQIYPGHCTGFKAIHHIFNNFPNNCHQLKTALKISF